MQSEDTYWLLGLPFDAIDLDSAAAFVRTSIRLRKRVLLATPNLNFVAEAHRNTAFREAILECTLSVVDGMPLVWLGRLSGIPFKERVAGSDLFEALRRSPSSHPIRVFFFGGDPGVAEAAHVALSKDPGCMIPVGWMNPGFGTVEQMSTDAIITRINDANADFLVVSLGAAKGHSWIQENRSKLNAPVISHLGAVVSFVAGRTRRAPPALRSLGLEWAWRISQEPRLLTRYSRDAIKLLGLLTYDIIARSAHALRTALRPTTPEGGDSAVNAHPRKGHRSRLKVPHRLTASTLQAFQEEIAATLDNEHRIEELDCSAVHALDSKGAGFLYSCRYRTEGARPAIFAVESSIGDATLSVHRLDPIVVRRNTP